MSNDRRVLAAIASLTALTLLVALTVTWQGQKPQVNLNDVPDDSIAYPIQGREHIPTGSPPRLYLSSPPTSGDHYASPVTVGFCDGQLPDAYLVHNLEHGHVWLSWRDAGDEAVVGLLRQLRAEFPEWVVVSHRPQNAQRLAAAAWGRLLPLDAPDRDALTAFIMRYRDRARESASD